MSEPNAPESRTGVCWYCGQNRGTNNSMTLPFWSNHNEEVRVLVLPRCDACFEFHHRQQFPSGMIIIGSAAAVAVPVSLLPLPESIRGVCMVLAILCGFAGGIFITANREDLLAKARGTRPSFDFMDHPPYRAMAADTDGWRQARNIGIGDGSSTRRETIDDYRRYLANDPVGLAALEAGVRAAGLDWH